MSADEDIADFSPGDEEPKGKRRGRQTHSAEEMEARISFTAGMLSQKVAAADIRRLLMERFSCSERMSHHYISRGQELLLTWSGLSKEAIRADVAGILQGLLRSNLKTFEKLAVLDRIIRLHGLEEATKLLLQGDKSSPLVVTVDNVVAARDKVAEWRNERFRGISRDAGTGEAASGNGHADGNGTAAGA